MPCLTTFFVHKPFFALGKAECVFLGPSYYFSFGSFRATEKAKPKELESQVPQKEIPKEDKQ
ncbi:hypothetical protein CK203_112430 [Vitis vinifera]|uniref:Uncharacterized protein n=1 Tax=Vitis vinifera TaxID=29760 RepID=A0A438DUX4_VITVI|nr:hypothetical protein CK203_112430 [Vitis vinifera]